MTNNDFYNALEEVCNDLELNFRDDYSGRFMYGSACIGIDFNYESELMEIYDRLEEYGKEYKDKFKNMMKHARYDSMGLGRIVYFPGESIE